MKVTKKVHPRDIAKYLVYKFLSDGDLVTNLKLQKMLYFVHVGYLLKNGKPCIAEKFQAWANGPVLPSIYHELKQYGAMPIGSEYLEMKTEKDFGLLRRRLGIKAINVMDAIYEQFGALSAFELVNFTHADKAWQKARGTAKTGEKSNTEISDRDILAAYGK